MKILLLMAAVLAVVVPVFAAVCLLIWPREICDVIDGIIRMPDEVED